MTTPRKTLGQIAFEAAFHFAEGCDVWENQGDGNQSEWERIAAAVALQCAQICLDEAAAHLRQAQGGDNTGASDPNHALKVKRGIRTDGIKTIADFRSRFVVCEESGCWEWRGKSYKGRCAQVWLSIIERQCSIGQAVYVLTHGEMMPDGKVMRCTCSTPNCGNPEHRKLVTRGRQVPKGRRKDAGTRIRIAKARREASRVGMTAEKAAAIRASDEPLRVLAERHGISPSFVSLIRLGKAWAPLAVGASVFSLSSR